MKTSTTLTVLALVSAAALAATSGGDDDDEKEPIEPGPPDDELDDDDEPKLPSVDDPEEPEEPGEPEPSIDPDAPTVPIPTPDPMDAVGVPGPQLPNVHVLETLDDFREWSVLDAVEPDGSVGAKRRVVMLGYDVGWVGRPIALARLSQLAAANPNVHFVVFTFQRSRELTGQPDHPLGYVATSIGPDGRARPDVFVGRKKVLGPLGQSVWTDLVRWAKDGPSDTQGELRRFDSKSGTPYVVEVEQEKSGFVFVWRWKIWREEVGDESDVVATNTKPSKAQAIDTARSYIANLAGEGQAGGGAVGGLLGG